MELLLSAMILAGSSLRSLASAKLPQQNSETLGSRRWETLLSQSRPLSKYFAEGVAIVVSILVAFGIDASWDQWKERQEESRILSALLVELEANRTRVSEQTVWHEDIQSAILALLQEGTTSASNLNTDSVDALIGRASWFNNSTTFEMSAIDAVVLGGRLPVIDSEALRQRITAWVRDVERVVQTERQDYDTFSDVWMPYLRTYGNLPQISDAITVQPGSGDANYGPATSLTARPTDHRALINDRQFRNVLLHRLWVQNDILYEYSELRPKLNALIQLMAGVVDD